MNPIIHDVLTYTAHALAACCLFYGALRLGERGLTRKALAPLMVGFVLAANFALGEFYSVSSMLQGSSLLQKKPRLAEFPPNWGEGLTAEQKAASIIVARSAFHWYGKLIEYVDRDGRRILFSPTEKDIQERDDVLTAIARFDTVSGLSRGVADRWLITAIATLVFGFVAGRMARRSAKTDA